MSKLQWHEAGKKLFETGVSKAVLFVMDNDGTYKPGIAWNGITSINESPSGAESNPQYADNEKYLDLVSAEDFNATLEAFMYPTEFEACDGLSDIIPGVTVGQQSRTKFALAYQTKIGNDVKNDAYGYKIHIIYGCLAAPTEKQYQTINDSPEAITFSWEISTTPVEVPDKKPSASMTINSTKVSAAALTAIEDILYGSESSESKLIMPKEISDIVSAG